MTARINGGMSRSEKAVSDSDIFASDSDIFKALSTGAGGFSAVGVLAFDGSKTVGDKVYYNFKVGNIPFSMTGKSGEWASEHDQQLCHVTGSLFAKDGQFAVKLYGNSVFPCVR